jgi:hypothetical protein
MPLHVFLSALNASFSSTVSPQHIQRPIYADGAEDQGPPQPRFCQLFCLFGPAMAITNTYSTRRVGCPAH